MPVFSSVSIKCKQCGELVLVQPHRFDTKRGKYCSPKCYQESRNPPEIKECLVCDEKIKSYISKPKKYCSKECANKGKTKSHIKRSGYLFIYRPEHRKTCVGNNGKGGYVREHIIMVEEHIGRYLNAGETVHHINEKRADNRIENLYLFPTVSAHSRYHQLSRHGKCEEITKSNLT